MERYTSQRQISLPIYWVLPLLMATMGQMIWLFTILDTYQSFILGSVCILKLILWMLVISDSKIKPGVVDEW